MRLLLVQKSEKRKKINFVKIDENVKLSNYKIRQLQTIIVIKSKGNKKVG